MPIPTDLVVKSNALVPALARLDLMELRLLCFCIAHINRDDKDFKLIKARAQDVANLFEIPIDRVYTLVKDLIKRINSKPAEYEDEDYYIVSVWFTTLKYGKKGDGEFVFKMNNDLKEHLLDLTQNFTAYRLKDVYQFKAASTWHIYEVLRQHKAQKKIEFYLDQFKTMIGVAGLYPRYNNLKFKVIDPAIKEINSVSDIKVEWEKITRGRRVEGLRFFIAPNEDTKTHKEQVRDKIERTFPPQPPKNPDFATRLREEFSVSSKQADQLARLWEGREAQAEKFLTRIRRDYALGTVKSLGGLTFKILRDEGQKEFLPGV